MKDWSISKRVLFASLAPTIIISLLVGAYFIYARLDDLDQSLTKQGISMANQLAPASEYALVSGSKNIIQGLAYSALKESELRAITIYNQQRLLLAHAGPAMYPLPNQAASQFPSTIRTYHTEDSLRIISPVIAGNNLTTSNTTTIRNNNSNSPGFNDRNQAKSQRIIIGWIEIELPYTSTSLKKYQALITSGLIILLGLLASCILAFRLSRSVTEPILTLSSTVGEIKEGNLDVRVDTGCGGELAVLESGINSMASSLKKAHEEMQESIDQATTDLRETLETIETQNIELNLARKKALKASQTKSEFLANMSHEIRTPLNAIIGFTSLLMKGSLSNQQKDYLTTIQKSSDSLLTIINDILDFSKIEAGKLQLDHIPVELHELIEEVLTMLAPSAHNKGLEINAVINKDVPGQIAGDPLRLKQIITNLVGNAIKFTHQGEVVIQVSLEDQTDHQAAIKIAVTDTGIGLSAKQQEILFNAFTQADTSTTRQFGGTGLGLVISKRLITQMGGEIGINSEEGKGSTFWISLKMDLTEQARNFTEGHHLLDDKHIAIFDENHHALTGLRNVLENWGARLTSYQQLEQLKSTIINQKTEHYDLLLIAINLAANKAKKQCELVKLIQQDYDSPLIILDNTKHYGEHQLAGNVNCWFITKPLVRHKLQQLLEKFLLQRVDGQVIADNPAQYNKKQAMPKILAVDDNPANLKLLCALLADLRLEVHTAETGVQAVTYTEKQNFDLIFMDIQMPDMDGIEATSRIRLQEKKGQHTPIVALTAHALPGEKENLLNSGMDDYITKPITQQVLVSMLTKWTQYDTRQSVDHQPEQHKTIDQSLAVFDQKASLKLVAGKESLAKEMLTMLLAELEQERQAINSAYKDNDRAVMLEKTHRLHGASRYTGAISLQHALANLEKALKQHQTDINLQLAALNKETSKVYLWIEKHRPFGIISSST